MSYSESPPYPDPDTARNEDPWASEALRVRDERLRLALEGAGAAIWEWDLRTGAIHWSPENFALWGRDPRDGPPSRTDWERGIHPDDRERIRRAMQEVIEGRSSEYRVEARIVHPSGEVRWLLGSGRLIRAADGTPERVTGVNMDVTERRRHDEERQRAHDTFYRIIQNNPFGVYVVDADFRLREISLGAQKVFGGVRPLLGRDFAEILRIIWTEPFASEAIARFRHTLDTGEPYVSPATTERRRDIETVEAYDWRIDRITLPDGRHGVVCYFYDLSDRQRWAAALGESETRLRLAKEAGGLGIHDFDVLTGRIDWDERVRELWGIDADTVVTYEMFLAGIHPDDREATERSVQRALDPAAGGRFYHEYRVISRATGTMRWVAATGQVTFTEGRAIRLVGTVQDISARKHAEEALLDADRRKDEFLATLAHELRNPLAPIRQAAALVKMPGATPAQVRWSHDVIERQANRMALLLDDLMDVSRITRGRIELHRVSVTVREIVETAVETVGPLVESRRHALQVHLPEAPLTVHGDPLRLSQVISNLLANAAKYTEPGGSIRLAASREGDEIRITVADNGIGIEPRSIETVFEMFAQAPATAQNMEGGLGIGLALARGLVELHGGTLTACSAGAGKGSEFLVRLPASDPESDTTPGAASPSTARPRCILIVDDNVDAAESLAIVLRLKGHEVHTAHNGVAGLDAAQQLQPEVALVDLGMPGMDGVQLASRLRGLEHGARMTIIAVTGWGQDEDRQRTRASGFDHHLTKPVDPSELEVLLQAASGAAR